MRKLVMKELRTWTLAEKLLDDLYHDPALVNSGEWRNKVAKILPGCPRNHPEGTFAEVATSTPDGG